MTLKKSREMILKGISGSPGICIGKAYVVDREGINIIERYPIAKAMLSKEIDRFKHAVAKAKKEHAKVIKALDKDVSETLNILETHMALFKDKMLYGRTIETIQNEQINAEWALRKVSRLIKLMFQEVEDPYLQSRVNDIVQVSDKIMSNLLGARDIKIADINKTGDHRGP